MNAPDEIQETEIVAGSMLSWAISESDPDCAEVLDRGVKAARKNTAKKPRAPKFDSLISSPWAKAPENSYYGDPRFVNREQHGLENIERDQIDEEGTEQVVIKGYN